MNINLTGTNLDLILLVVFSLSVLFGLKNGFIDSLIRFVMTILVLVGAWFLSTPISYFIPIPELPIEAQMIAFIEPMLQKIIAFIGIFIILIIVKNIIYILIKPIIKKIIEFFKIVNLANRLLGALFNVVKNIIISSLLLACLNLPIFTNGAQLLEESKGAKLIIAVTPTISQQIIEFGETVVDFTQIETWATQEFTIKNLIELFDAMNDYGVLNEEQLSTFYMSYSSQIQSIPNAQVSKNQYDELVEMIQQLPGNENLKTLLMSKISYQ